MNWFVLVIISVLISSLANVLQKVLMKKDKSDPKSYAVVFHLLIGSINLIFALIFGFSFPQMNFLLVYYVIAAVLWGTGTVFLYKALQILESSEVIILISGRTIITIIAAVVFLGDNFGLHDIIGTILIIVAIVLVSHLKKGFVISRGTFFAFMTSVCYGSAVVFDIVIVKKYDPISYLAIANLLIGVILLITYPYTTKRWRHFVKPDFMKRMIPLGVLSSVQAIAYYFALQSGPAVQIAAVGQSSVIVTIIFSSILLKERDRLFIKFIASVLVFTGVMLLR